MTVGAVLAIIPARGGSKRVPRKNVKLLGGKPLIAWTIESALESGVCTHIVVSTDDAEIAEAAAAAGAPVLAMRPDELSRDESSSIAVIEHEIRQQRARGIAVDTVVLLQPTSPFRRPSTIQRGLALFARHDRRSVVSVSPVTDHPSWCRAIDANGCLRPVDEHLSLSSMGQLNGLLYIAHADHVLAHSSLYSDPTTALVINDRVESLDIDTPLDWCFAEAIIAATLQEKA